MSYLSLKLITILIIIRNNSAFYVYVCFALYLRIPLWYTARSFFKLMKQLVADQTPRSIFVGCYPLHCFLWDIWFWRLESSFLQKIMDLSSLVMIRFHDYFWLDVLFYQGSYLHWIGSWSLAVSYPLKNLKITLTLPRLFYYFL